VGGVDGEMSRQRLDVADPVDPRARAAMEQQQGRLAGTFAPDVPHLLAAVPHRHLHGARGGGDGIDGFERGAAVRHARDGGVIETHVLMAPRRRSTKPLARLRSTQRSTVTRSLSGSIQTMWLPQPNAK